MKYIIGDVHGCFDTLMALIAKLPKDAELVFVGDLVDRGPKNRAVINFVRDGGYDCLMGNHEDLMIKATESYVKWNSPFWGSDWVYNGGDKTLAEYDSEDTPNMDELLIDIEWMKNLPAMIRFPHERDTRNRELIVTHAPSLEFMEPYFDLGPDDRLSRQSLEMNFMWNRRIPKDEQTEFFNVFGHNIIDNFIFNKSGGLKVEKEVVTPHNTLLDYEKGYAGIDTGCFVKGSKSPFRAKLTCIEFPTMRIIQQENIEESK